MSGTLVKVVTVKLLTSPETDEALVDTMRVFHAVCNRVSERAWQSQSFRAYDLHYACYHDLRGQFGLPAQLTVRAIAKVADSYKIDRSVRHTFGTRSAVVFDARCFRLRNHSCVELTTTQGRKSFVMRHGGKQRRDLEGATTGEADLLYRDGSYYLAITVKKPAPPPAQTSGVLGIDLGITQIATDSEGEHFSGAPVKAVRRRLKRLRGLLQHRGTKSAKDHLRRLRGRQARFIANVNHIISKAIVQKAVLSAKALALEDLRGIRQRASALCRETRWLLGNWAFADLAAKICYKAAQAGVPVLFVDPRNTSRLCAGCGYCDRANRTSQAHFKCLQCGREANADFNAALNIAARGVKSYAAFAA